MASSKKAQAEFNLAKDDIIIFLALKALSSSVSGSAVMFNDALYRAVVDSGIAKILGVTPSSVLGSLNINERVTEAMNRVGISEVD